MALGRVTKLKPAFWETIMANAPRLIKHLCSPYCVQTLGMKRHKDKDKWPTPTHSPVIERTMKGKVREAVGFGVFGSNWISLNPMRLTAPDRFIILNQKKQHFYLISSKIKVFLSFYRLLQHPTLSSPCSFPNEAIHCKSGLSLLENQSMVNTGRRFDCHSWCLLYLFL